MCNITQPQIFRKFFIYTENQYIMDFRDVKGKKVKLPKDKKYNWRPAVYGVLIENNKLLFIKPNWDDKYCLPGGSMDLGETTTKSLEREFMEETGYRIKVKNPDHPYADNFLFGSDKVDQYFQRISLYYEVERVSKKQSKNLDEETTELHWEDVNNLSSSDFTFFQRDFLKTILKK
ncbi:NUDIX domain-containing protein [Candidatus Woesearchaeota archaeon]|nr:NUDIX domain-containing protein [Candidatus Woesearchaeota archaeon]